MKSLIRLAWAAGAVLVCWFAVESFIEAQHDSRPGLLYTLSRKIFELGLSVELAKISTHLDQVVAGAHHKRGLGQGGLSRRVHVGEAELLHERDVMHTHRQVSLLSARRSFGSGFVGAGR